MKVFSIFAILIFLTIDDAVAEEWAQLQLSFSPGSSANSNYTSDLFRENTELELCYYFTSSEPSFESRDFDCRIFEVSRSQISGGGSFRVTDRNSRYIFYRPDWGVVYGSLRTASPGEDLETVAYVPITLVTGDDFNDRPAWTQMFEYYLSMDDVILQYRQGPAGLSHFLNSVPHTRYITASAAFRTDMTRDTDVYIDLFSPGGLLGPSDTFSIEDIGATNRLLTTMANWHEGYGEFADDHYLSQNFVTNLYIRLLESYESMVREGRLHDRTRHETVAVNLWRFMRSLTQPGFSTGSTLALLAAAIEYSEISTSSHLENCIRLGEEALSAMVRSHVEIDSSEEMNQVLVEWLNAQARLIEKNLSSSVETFFEILRNTNDCAYRFSLDPTVDEGEINFDGIEYEMFMDHISDMTQDQHERPISRYLSFYENLIEVISKHDTFLSLLSEAKFYPEIQFMTVLHVTQSRRQ
ncbi:MAG: hypothetical protein RKK11_10930 [Alphaproteobacteria bacterium]